MRARIYVTLKRSVLDPQGKAVEQSLHSLGFCEVRDVRIGKYIEMELQSDDAEQARARIEAMCRQLLANAVIEEYRFEIQP